MKLEICLATCTQETVTNPSTESSYSKEEWDALEYREQAAWLQDELKEWAYGLIDYWWES
jgi:hypothetical protein